MTDWLDIGASPSGESCAQVGSPGYHGRARRECRAFIGQLRRLFGPEPGGAWLVIRNNPHDFGDYLSVTCEFNPSEPAAVEYAYRCENNAPERWDAPARLELNLKEVSDGNLD